MLFPTVVAALLLSVNCLYDGDEVQWNRHGYVVKLVIREHLTDNSSTCTGSLISPSAVLTSSKCFPRTDEVNYEAVVIVPTPGSRKTMNKAMLDVYVKDEIAILRIDTVKVPLCPRPPAPSRIARLNIKSTFLSHPYKKVSVDDLKDLNCRVLGFKTENDGDDFTIKHQAMSIDVGLREETDSLMFAENENLGMACWGDIGAPLECALNEEGTFVQVGVLRSVYAVSPSEDWDSSNATCTDVKTMQFAVFVDDTVAQGVENVDKVGLFTAYHKCDYN